MLFYLFMARAVFRAGPSAVVAVGFAAFMLSAVLAVFKSRVFASSFIAVMLPAIQISAGIFSQLSTLQAAAVHAVGFKFTNRHLSAPITHILLRLVFGRLWGFCGIGRGVGMGCRRLCSFRGTDARGAGCCGQA